MADPIAFTPFTGDETDYTAKLNTDFNAISEGFQALAGVTTNSTFLDSLSLLPQALGLTGADPNPPIVPPTTTVLELGEVNYISDINDNFAAIETAFGATGATLEGANDIASLSRFAGAVLGPQACLVGDHSYFPSVQGGVIITQPGYAWLPWVPAIVQNTKNIGQFLAGGQYAGDWWYMIIDKTGYPLWVLNRSQVVSNPFFKCWVAFDYGSPDPPPSSNNGPVDPSTGVPVGFIPQGVWIIYPPIQLQPILQLAPVEPVETPQYPIMDNLDKVFDNFNINTSTGLLANEFTPYEGYITTVE